MYNKKVLREAINNLDRTKAPAKKQDMIVDPMGQWKYPGQNTRIPGNDITMQGVPYPVWAVPNVGTPQMMYPEQDYYFPGADHVDEYPQIAQRGVQLSKAQNGLIITDPAAYKYRKAMYDDSLTLYNLQHDLRKKHNSAMIHGYNKYLNAYRNIRTPSSFFTLSPTAKAAYIKKEKEKQANLDKLYNEAEKKRQDAVSKFLSYNKKNPLNKADDYSITEHWLTGTAPGKKPIFIKNKKSALPYYEKPVQPVYYKELETPPVSLAFVPPTITDLEFEPPIEPETQWTNSNPELDVEQREPEPKTYIPEFKRQYRYNPKSFSNLWGLKPRYGHWVDVPVEAYGGDISIPELNQYQDGGPTYVSTTNPKDQLGYDAAWDTITYNPNSEIENINNPWWKAHEDFHHTQNMSGRLSTYGIVGQRPNPYLASGEAMQGYYNRRQSDLDNEVNKMIQQNPSLQFIPREKLYESLPGFIGATERMYKNPNTVEGEAREVEMQYEKLGGDISIPQLNQYEDGGEYDLTQEEIDDLIAQGYNIEDVTDEYQVGGPYNTSGPVSEPASEQDEIQEYTPALKPKAYGYEPEDYSQFQNFAQTLPSNLQDPGYQYGNPDQYDLYGMWRTVDKPKSFKDVQDTDYFTLQPDNTYHGFSVGDDGTLLKPMGHHTTWMEVMNSQLNTDPYFRENRLIKNEQGRLQYVPNRQDGGVSPLEGNYISKVLMNRNRGVDFVDRAYALGDNPGTPLFNVPDDEEFGNRMSHKMSWGTDDQGQTWMFPTVLNPNDEAIKVPNQYADYISSEGYKYATGMKQKGGFQDDINRRRKLLRDWTYGASIGTLHEAEYGIEMDLTPEEIEQYKKGGYIVEEY